MGVWNDTAIKREPLQARFFSFFFSEESNNGFFRPSHVLNSLGKPRMQMDKESGHGKERRENRKS